MKKYLLLALILAGGIGFYIYNNNAVKNLESTQAAQVGAIQTSQPTTLPITPPPQKPKQPTPQNYADCYRKFPNANACAVVNGWNKYVYNYTIWLSNNPQGFDPQNYASYDYCIEGAIGAELYCKQQCRAKYPNPPHSFINGGNGGTIFYPPQPRQTDPNGAPRRQCYKGCNDNYSNESQACQDAFLLPTDTPTPTPTNIANPITNTTVPIQSTIPSQTSTTQSSPSSSATATYSSNPTASPKSS